MYNLGCFVIVNYLGLCNVNNINFFWEGNRLKKTPQQ